MPVPEEKLYKSDKINAFFAVSSVLMLVSILWLIVEDYDRPWRETQNDFYLQTAALAHLDYLNAITEENVEAIEQKKQELEARRQSVASTKGEVRADLQEQLVQANLEFKIANDPWSRLSQVLVVDRTHYEHLLAEHGPDEPRTREAAEVVRGKEEELERRRIKKEQAQDRIKELEDQLKAIEEPIVELERQVRELEQAQRDALQKDMQYRGVLTDEGILGGLPIVRALINAPLLDFTAPKNTPGRHQINQLVLYDVKQRLNYLEGYTTDRCTTCHVAINDPNFSMDVLAAKLEQSIPGINEALQRSGADPLPFPTPPKTAGGRDLPVGKVTDYWELLSKEQQQAYFKVLNDVINSYLESSGRKTLELGEPLLAHPDLDLYVSVDSPHPMSTMGCTVCHEGNPQETQFVFAAHSPPTHEVEEHWKDEYYEHNLGVPTVTFETMNHYWDRPMRWPEHTEAGCTKCHTQVADIKDFGTQQHGERINLGRNLFTSVGCINCHNIEGLSDSRRVGPSLERISDKLSPEFVQQWVYFPQKFRPSTRMPHFFMQENNGPGGANELDTEPVTRTETEVAAMSGYLFAVASEDWQPLPMPSDIQGDAGRGRELFTNVGCLACHGNLTEFGVEWIAADLEQREGIDAERARKRAESLTYVEQARYALEHFPSDEETWLNAEEVIFDAAKEQNEPIFTRFAPDLSGIGSKVNEEWLYSWLREPQHYSGETKMPSLRLSEREAVDITAYLMTLKHDAFDQREFAMTPERAAMADDLVFQLLAAQRSERRSRQIMNDEAGELTDMMVGLLKKSLGEERARAIISSMDVQDKKLMYLGNKMISHYGCYACHTIPGFEEAAPPGTDLSGWGEKPISQLDFAFFDHAFHHLREEKPDVFGFVYPQENEDKNGAERLNSPSYWSPLPERTHEQITHTHAAFAQHKMLNPRIWDREKLKGPYDKLKMPNFYFTKREADALTTYLLSRVPPRVAENLKVDYDNSPKGAIAEGRHLTRELNCIGCHEFEDNAPTVHQYFIKDFGGEQALDRLNAPPTLRGEGAKVQHSFLHRFLQHVEPLRPWLQVRMPSFYITNDEATVLAKYFAALSQDQSQKLGTLLARLDEFGGRPENIDSADAADWFLEPSLRDEAAQLRHWAIEERLMREAEFDPIRNDPDALRDAHANLIERAEFLSDLYDVEYPFVQPAKLLSPQERFERGADFFGDMGCLNCHVLGEMLPGPPQTTDDFVQMYRLDSVRGEGDDALVVLNGVAYPVGADIDGFTVVSGENTYFGPADVITTAIIEGPNAEGETEKISLKAPSAPNLSLTYRRLRYDWVTDWMLNPHWIQPGTKMPQNFPGGKSQFEGSEKYPGTSEEHLSLLVDYLYDAGVKNVRAPLPKIVIEDTPAEEFDPDAFDMD